METNQIKQIIQKKKFDIYGIRADNGIRYNVGDTCHISHQWWQDDPGEEAGLEYNKEMECWDGGVLPGTCALGVTADSLDDVLNNASAYGVYIVLVAGDSWECGNDAGEVIIEDAKVLAVIK